MAQTPDATGGTSSTPGKEEPGKMIAVCAWCSNSTFWRSRLRVADWPELLQLRAPVRCKQCSHRQFVSLRTRFGADGIRPQIHRAVER